jgi:hypothetical protein
MNPAVSIMQPVQLRSGFSEENFLSEEGFHCVQVDRKAGNGDKYRVRRSGRVSGLITVALDVLKMD